MNLTIGEPARKKLHEQLDQILAAIEGQNILHGRHFTILTPEASDVLGLKVHSEVHVNLTMLLGTKKITPQEFDSLTFDARRRGING